MELQILSHAGLRVTCSGKTLLVDPWLVGSCYWRSWWNYPPVDPALYEGLRPDAIYLTHLHWDHFHGPSLRKFPRETRILCPRGHDDRMRRDLTQMGFKHVEELRHGVEVALGPGFTLTPYEFNPALDSAVVIEGDGVTVLDANDAKLMGGPLRQVLRRHPRIDFALRSHSSANGRLCIDVVDGPPLEAPKDTRYLSAFYRFMALVRPRYAVPFASNHCFLHEEVWPLNDTVTTPLAVRDYWNAQASLPGTELKLMLSGDRWSSETGFDVRSDPDDLFGRRPEHLRAYRERMAPKLAAHAALEARAKPTLARVQKHVAHYRSLMPWPLRRYLRDTHFVFELPSGERTARYRADYAAGTAEELDEAGLAALKDPIVIRTAAFIFNQCVSLDLFGHLPISKRFRVRLQRRQLPKMYALQMTWWAADFGLLPLGKLASRRFLGTALDRWREGLLYGQVFLEKFLLRRPFDEDRYLRPSRFGRARTAPAPAAVRPLTPALRVLERPPQRREDARGELLGRLGRVEPEQVREVE